jgi:thermitase
MGVFGMNGHINEHGCSSHGKGSKGFRPLLALAIAALTIGVAVALSTGLSPAGASVSPPPSGASSVAAALTATASDVQPPPASTPAPFRPGVVLVGFREGISLGERYALEQAAGGQGARHLGPTIRPAGHGNVAGQEFISPLALQVPAPQTQAVIDRLRRDPAVAYAEPDYLMLASATPNDPSFPLQWADNNTGQSVPYQESAEILGSPIPGTSGDDDGALAAWQQVSTGSRSIVVGETDTGVDYQHPDLAANIWSNPGGIGGCPAGTHGYNTLSKSCDPMDTDTAYGGHGTHVAGIMGAMGNNSAGVAGVNWQSTILPVKWLSTASYGETGALIEALQWLVAAKQGGVNLRVVNDSATFVGTASSQALSNEIDVLGANNILFVTAAGNTGENNDELADRRYPCGYDRPTEICVTASNDKDELPSWANYGPHTVNLAAPGVSIYSTLRENKYGYLSGGSMASPQVAGAAALILSVKPSLSVNELRADILENVDPLPALSGRVISGGVLDICKALPGCKRQAPPPPPATFGKTTVGASSDYGIFANYKVVNPATLTVAGSVTKLGVYAIPGIASPSPQALEGVIYADSGGSPGALVARGPEVIYRGNSNGAGWLELPLSAPTALSPGKYWLGFITGASSEGMGYTYDSVANSRAYNENAYTSGPTNPFGSFTEDSEQASIYATYIPAGQKISPPTNTAPPTISGTAQTGQTLKASTGSWTESPTGYAYQWQRCEATGASCAPISAATAQTYALGAADLGKTLRVAVTASNGAGVSTPATSAQTAVIKQAPATFGKTSVGASSDSFAANRKRVSRYALPTAGSVTRLSIYLAPTGASGQQTLEGVIYSDTGGTPGALLGVSKQLIFTSTSAAGWYELTLASPIELAAGNYWIGLMTGSTGNVAGFRYDYIAGTRYYNSNTYTSGPSNPFGSFSTDGEQTSLYATYTPG